MSEATMLLVKALIFGMIFTGVLGFFFIRYMSRHTDTAVSRLNRETEQVRSKQIELNMKIKQANEELETRKREADALVVKMTEDAEESATKEREKIIKKARQDAEDIINKAQKTKDEIRRALESEMKLKAVDFAALLLQEILTTRSIEILDENIIMEFLEDLRNVDTEVIGADIDMAEVVTSRPFSDQARKKLTETLKEKLAREIRIDTKLDESLVLGIMVKFATLSLDGSFKNLMLIHTDDVKTKLEKGLI